MHRKRKEKKRTPDVGKLQTTNVTMCTCNSKAIMFYVFFLQCFCTQNSLLFNIEMQGKKIKSEGILNEFTTKIAFCYPPF